MSELQGALGRLYGLVGRGQKLGLERMAASCSMLGNPERAFSAIHVSGTNGKGTVCAFVASMLRAAGKSVGMYTSPHLCRFAERIQINGEPIADDFLERVLSQALDVMPEGTFFEVSTLAAFLAFREAGVEHAVIEVGLGGRLDATNVLPPPAVAVITRVSFDHMDELGATIALIAAEKAAIIKAGSKVVLGKLHPDARAVIEARIAEVGAEEIPLGGPEPIPGAPLAYPRVAMIGTNLAVATTVGTALGLAPQKIADGIETTAWPGRNELLHRDGQELTLLDSAHNPDGTVALSHALDPSMLGDEISRRDIALVFGTLATKNYRAMLKRLEGVAFHRVYVAPPARNAADPALFPPILKGEVVASVEAALARARELAGPKGVVVVTGSTYLVGAARAILLSLPTDPAVQL